MGPRWLFSCIFSSYRCRLGDFYCAGIDTARLVPLEKDSKSLHPEVWAPISAMADGCDAVRGDGHGREAISMDAPPNAQIVAKENFPNETVATGPKTHGLPASKCLAASSGDETAVHENILWSADWAKTGRVSPRGLPDLPVLLKYSP